MILFTWITYCASLAIAIVSCSVEFNQRDQWTERLLTERKHVLSDPFDYSRVEETASFSVQLLVHSAS